MLRDAFHYITRLEQYGHFAYQCRSNFNCLGEMREEIGVGHAVVNDLYVRRVGPCRYIFIVSLIADLPLPSEE